MTGMEHTINREKTIYGYDDVYKFIVTNPKLVNNGHNNEYRCNNVLFILTKEYLHIRIYTDHTNDTCVLSLLLCYSDFATRYTQGERDIILLSRKGERVSAEMYISIKGILA